MYKSVYVLIIYALLIWVLYIGVQLFKKLGWKSISLQKLNIFVCHTWHIAFEFFMAFLKFSAEKWHKDVSNESHLGSFNTECKIENASTSILLFFHR